MKNILLVFLVFITSILKGQSVDPETFPTLKTGIGNKYLYTNTGGEGKMLVDSVATRSRIYWRNGVNGQDSLGLGGGLVQNTNIDLNNFSMTFLNSPLSGFGSYPYGTYQQYVMIQDLNNNIAALNALKDTAVGSESLYSGNNIKDLGDDSECGFYNKYTLSTDEQTTYWRKFTPLDGEINVRLDKSDGFTITPFSQVGVNTYLGQNIFKIVDTLNNDIFKIKINGNIEAQLPTHVDEAAATLAGLPQNTFYKTPTGEVRIKL